MNTLPDWLDDNLRLMSIGLNPSLPSARAGYPFANPRNRFWPALNASRLVAEPIEPGVAGIERLFRDYRIGFTDVVRRPTPGGSDLRAADYRKHAPELHQKLVRYQPGLAWFHGKQAYRAYLRYGEGERPDTLDWGLQPRSIDGVPVFVTPNPSPANAAYSPDDLVAWYDRLAEMIEASRSRPA